MAFHRLEQIGFCGAGIQIENRVERVDFEKVTVRLAGRRSRAAVAGLLEIIHALLRAAGQFRRFRHIFGKAGGRRRQIVNHPMHPRSHRRVGIVADERQAFRGGRHARPLQRGRKIFVIVGVLCRNRLAVGKGGAGDLNLHGGFDGWGIVRAAGRKQNGQRRDGENQFDLRAHAGILSQTA